MLLKIAISEKRTIGLSTKFYETKTTASEYEEYFKLLLNKKANQQVEPIVTTPAIAEAMADKPVDKVEAQSTQAHPRTLK